MLKLRWGSATDVGRVRQVNEDSLFCSDVLFAVADGMGGHAAGELASGLAVQAMAEFGESGPLDVDGLAAAIEHANQVIVQTGRQQPAYFGLGTTLTGVAVLGVAGAEHWAVFNVGDSRVYRYAEDRLSQLSVDHSAVQELIDAGVLDEDGARHHPQRNVVTRSLGTSPAPQADIDVYQPVLGERLLICSDGLTNELLDAEIAQVLQVETEPEQSAAELVRRANQSGGRDNTTVVVIELTGLD
ncbi:MAG TPA: PP2C family serine/threonine-protein phosphatase [Jatrophihabitans sp.]|nr:PP2C family serine/threonine-protein phosphatase [Jatrophihabitans sp.]